MCLPQEIPHTFRNRRSSKELWEALEKRYEGNPQVKKGKTELLKKQFAVFRFIMGEDLEDIITRYYHLMKELDNHGVVYTEPEKTDKLLDALPQQWEVYSLMIKNDQAKYAAMTLKDVIDKLRDYNFELKKKDLETDQVQDPGVCNGKSSSGSTSTGGTTAFVSGTAEEGTGLESEGVSFIAASGSEEPGNSAQAFTAEVTEDGHVEMDTKDAQEDVQESEFEVLNLNSTGNISIEDFIAHMTDLDTDKDKVCLNLSTIINVCKLFTYQKEQLRTLAESSTSMSTQINSLKRENKYLNESKFELVSKIKSAAKDITALKDIVNEKSLRMDIVYEHVEDLTKQVSAKDKELADAKVKIVELNRKFEQYRNSSLTLSNIISSQRSSKDVTGLGYSEVPPPFNSNYSSLSKEDELTDVNDSADPSVSKLSEVNESEKDQSSTSDKRTVVIEPTEKLSKEDFKTPPQNFQKRVHFVSSGVYVGDSKVESDVKVNEKLKEKTEQTPTPGQKISKAFPKKAIEKMSCFKCHTKGHVASCCPNKKMEAVIKQVKKNKSPVRSNTNGTSTSTSQRTTERSIVTKPWWGKRPRSNSPKMNSSNGKTANNKYIRRHQTLSRTQNRFQSGSTFHSQWDYYRNMHNSINQPRVQQNSGFQSRRPVTQRVYQYYPNKRHKGNTYQHVKPILRESKSPERRDGYLKEFTFVDEKGQSKTVTIWVPRYN